MIQSIPPHSRPDVGLLMPDLRAGGAERVNINLANELASRGYSVDIIVFVGKGELEPLISPGIRVVELGSERLRQGLLPLARYLRSSTPRSLLACMWPVPIIALTARALARSRTRVIVAEHTTWSAGNQRGGLARRLSISGSMRLAYRYADAVVAVSQGAADDLAKIAGLKPGLVNAIYNPIVGGRRLSQSILGASYPRWSEGHHKKILAVGTLKEIKDYRTLLEAFAKLRVRIDARLLILGEGDERQDLQSRARALGIADQLVMPGFVADPTAFYEMADLHVLSSRGEGLPTVLVEALEAGTPIVSTDCRSGPREILDNGRFGILVPVADAGALAEAMFTSLTSNHDVDALKARSRDFSVQKATDAYLALLLPERRP